MFEVAILGATGYVGIEIVRILQNHPEFKVTFAGSHSFVGKKISDIYPNFRGLLDIECEEFNINNNPNADFYITALSDDVSKDVIPDLVEKGKTVLDHSGLFRYKKTEVYEKWYKTKHVMPQLLEKAVYGLPEIYRNEIKNAKLVANPGCYPTCSILGLAPLISQKLIDTGSIIIDAASGVSGAGRKTDLPYQFCECTENFKAYGVSTHRHTSEIEQELSFLAGEDLLISFTPHLVPMKRGMLCTIYADLAGSQSTADIISLYKEYYKDEYFVRILDEGKLPETKFVAGSNFLDIGIVVDRRLNRVVILSAVDNLGKGAAGQAVQDLNILAGLPENTGLTSPGLYI